MFDFKGKIVLITGASGGIGRVMAEKFSKNKAVLALNDIPPVKEGLESLVSEIEKKGGKAKYFLADVTKFEEVERVMRNIRKEFGKLDILINNAGTIADRTLAKMTQEEWQKVIDVNLTGTFNCSKLALPLLIPNQGKIISISSLVGQRGNFGQTNYAAAKAGIIGFTKSLSKEVGRFGMTVNAIAPGFIETKMIDKVPDQIKEMIKKLTSLGKFGKPEDVANAVLFLASEQANFITGTILNVDGGLAI